MLDVEPSLHSRGAAAQENGRDRLGEDLKIEPNGPVLDIMAVQFHPLHEGKVISPADLPKTCDARLDRQPAAMEPLVTINLFGKWRPWTNQGHFALQHVDELRQFIDAGPANETPYGSDP